MVLLIWFSAAFGWRSTVRVDKFSTPAEAKAVMKQRFEDNILEEKIFKLNFDYDLKDQLLNIGVDLYMYADDEIAYSDNAGNVEHWKVAVI